ncbi:MAG: prolyl oligopeptidase family serine peptidase [Pseudoxanthomonas sp.]
MRRIAPFVLILLLSACAGTRPAADAGHFEARSLRLDGQPWRYQVFVPAPQFRQRPVPMLLFLHGSGERGTDNRSTLKVGLPRHLRHHRRDFPAVVVIPQARPGQEWIGPSLDAALAALDAAANEFDGDRQRTYLTGLSMGGYGVWEAALAEPGRFAALVPIAGALSAPSDEPPLRVTQVEHEKDPYTAVARRLPGMPVWMFHGQDDDEVSVHDDRRLSKVLAAAGNPVHYTEFPNQGHGIWDQAYANPALWTWLFAQSTAGREAQAQ